MNRPSINIWFVVILSGIFVCLTANLAPVHAQNKASANTQKAEIETLPDNLTSENVDDFLARIDDTRVRRILLSLLQQELERRQRESQTTVEPDVSFEEKVATLMPRLRFMLSGVTALPRDLNVVFQNMADRRGAGQYLWILIALIIGGLIEGVVRKKTAGRLHRYGNNDQLSGITRLGHIGGRALLQLAYLGVFVAAAFISVLVFYRQPGPPQLLAMKVLSAIVMIRVLSLAANVLFYPRISSLRLLYVDDLTASFFYRWVVAIGSFWILTVKVLSILQTLGGSEHGRLFLNSVFILVLASMLAALGWTNRQRLLKEGLPEESEAREVKSLLKTRYAPTLSLVFVFYVAVLWFFAQTGALTGAGHIEPRALISILIVPLYILFDVLGLQLLDMIFAKRTPIGEKTGNMEEEDEGQVIQEKEAKEDTRIKNYHMASRNVFRAMLIILTVGFVSRLWGIEGSLFRDAVLKALFNISVSVLLAYFFWTYIKSYTEKKLGSAEESAGEGFADEMGGAGSRDRSHTLLPILQKFIGVVLLVTVVLIILSSIGVKIGPLLASASIFGLAIGLGSQTVVKDMVAGFFFLVDDAFRVGDYVNVGNEQGTVIKTSMRTLTIRHYKGQLQILTYGDIKSVTNWSRGPMLLKFSLQLPAETNAQKVKKIIKKVSADMMEEEEYGPNLLEPIKSQGVNKIEDGVMTIRVKFRAKPGTQFKIKREAFRRIHEALTEKGIKFASRGVTVNVPPELKAPNESVAPSQGTTTPSPPSPDLLKTAAGAAAGIILEDTKKKKIL